MLGFLELSDVVSTGIAFLAFTIDVVVVLVVTVKSVAMRRRSRHQATMSDDVAPLLGRYTNYGMDASKQGLASSALLSMKRY